MPLTSAKVSSIENLVHDKYFEDIEKYSRCISTPLTPTQRFHTRWFFEYEPGQYQSSKGNNSFTDARKKAFETRYPEPQIFTISDLAKYVNAYKETLSGKKIILGPYHVAGDSYINRELFCKHNLEKKVTSVYYEDLISKIIFYKSCESVYDQLYIHDPEQKDITVAFVASLFNFLTKNQLDLYKIWRSQGVSEDVKNELSLLMKHVQAFVKTHIQNENQEWLMSEIGWTALKTLKFTLNTEKISNDLIGRPPIQKRTALTKEEITTIEVKEQTDKLKSLPSPIWKKIEDFGYKTKLLTDYEMKIAYAIAGKVRNNLPFLDTERETGLKIMDVVIENAPELLEEAEAMVQKKVETTRKIDVSLELIAKVVKWDKRNKKLKNIEYAFMSNIVEGTTPFTDNNKQIARWNIEKAFRYGFTE